MVKSVACPRCGVAVPWSPANRHRPFCSARCKLMDLGAWANEAYRVPAAEDRQEPGVDEEPSTGDPGR